MDLKKVSTAVLEANFQRLSKKLEGGINMETTYAAYQLVIKELKNRGINPRVAR